MMIEKISKDDVYIDLTGIEAKLNEVIDKVNELEKRVGGGIEGTGKEDILDYRER
jgi:hypothetical protein